MSNIKIEGHRNDYGVHKNGRIFSYGSNRFMKLKTEKSGYVTINLRLKGETKRKTRYVHRLVAEYFIPNKGKLKFVNHIDGDKSNNDVSNLEWCTRIYNNRHAIKNGLWNHKGENHSLSKLSNLEVEEIKEIYASGGISQKKLGDKYNVSQSCIYKIVNNLRWTK